MVVVAQLVRAPDCGSGGRRFETDLPPLRSEKFRLFAFFYKLFYSWAIAIETPFLSSLFAVEISTDSNLVESSI